MMIKMFSPRAQQFEKSVFLFFVFFSLGLFQKISFRPWMGGKKKKKTQRIYFSMKIICLFLVLPVLKLFKVKI